MKYFALYNVSKLEKSHKHGDDELFLKIIKTIGVPTIILGFGLDQCCM
jgi:hypothetical protein